MTNVENILTEIKKWNSSSLRGLLVHTLDQRRQDRIATRRTNVRILQQRGPKALAKVLWDRTLTRFGLR